MNLYRHTDGSISLHPYDPGAGYTFLGEAPAGPVTAVAEWWRDVDRGDLTSDWHPSLQGGVEVPKPPGLAGSGVNVWSPRYSNFEEVDGLPPFYLNGCEVDRAEPGFNGGYRLLVRATSNDGECWFTNGPDNYNIKLTPNMRWIISGYFINDGASQGFTAILRTIDQDYEMVSVALPTGAWERQSKGLDLRLDNSVGAMFGLKIPNAGGVVQVDALMLEEWLGTDATPSAYYAPPTIVVGDQVIAETLSVSRAAQTLEFAVLAQSSSPIILWSPVAPEARFRGKVHLSITAEIERTDTTRDSTVWVTFYRAGVIMRQVRHTVVIGQDYATIHAAWIDVSYDLNEIQYDVALHCPDETFSQRGVGYMVEVKK